MYFGSSFVLLLVAGAAYGASPAWNNLKVTWSLNPFNFWAFDAVPRDLNGKHKDYTLRDDQCKIQNAKFLGQRYWYKQDPALSLLYDKNGIIAGIQTSIPKKDFTPASQLANRNYIEDGDHWTLTAYFVDPSTICGTGRTQDQLKQEGTGNGLWIQNGPNPITDSISVPLKEEDAKKTLWKFGHCFMTMGNHYWFNVTKDMSCNDFVPNCLMYNKGKLTAFCFAVNADLKSKRYEHPPHSALPKFIDPVPECFSKDPAYAKLSTMHIYMIDNPRTGSLC